MTYFALRSYQDDGEHYDGQIGSEPTPAEFLAALWAVMDECWRVLKPTGSLFLNLGDKYAGTQPGSYRRDTQPFATQLGDRSHRLTAEATRQAPDVGFDVRTKSLMGLPWRFALGLTCPDTYRTDGHAGPQWTLRAEIIWSKPNGLPESVTDRVRRSHEQWFHLTRGPKYYAGVDEIREPNDPRWAQRRLTPHFLKANDNADRIGRWSGIESTEPTTGSNPLGKLPGSVWTIPSEPLVVPDHIGVDHFAAFPQEWVRRLVLGWTPNGICTKCGEGRRPVVAKRLTNVWHDKPVQSTKFGEVDAHRNGRLKPTDPMMSTYGSTEATITGYACACDVTLAPTRPAVVFDPFVGTGTVPMTARALGRYGVGLDLSHDYLRLARWRIGESKHGAKSTNRTNRERQGNLW